MRANRSNEAPINTLSINIQWPKCVRFLDRSRHRLVIILSRGSRSSSGCRLISGAVLSKRGETVIGRGREKADSTEEAEDTENTSRKRINVRRQCEHVL